MRRSMWTVLGSGLLVAALSTGAQAQVSARIFDRLDLSDEQKAQLTEVREQHREAAEAARAEMIKARAELDALMVASERDLAAIEVAMKKVSDLQVADRMRGLRNQEQMLSILTEEQRTQLESLRGTRGPRAARGRGMGIRPGMRGRRGPAAGGQGPGAVPAPGRGARAGRPGRAIPPRAGQGPGAGPMAGGPVQGMRRGGFGPGPAQPQGTPGPAPLRLRLHQVPPDVVPPPPPAA